MNNRLPDAEIEELSKAAYGDRHESGFTDEQIEFRRDVVINKIAGFKLPGIMEAYLTFPMYKDFQTESERIKNLLSGYKGKQKFNFLFGAFAVDFTEKKCFVMGIIEYRSWDCLSYVAIVLHHLEQIYSITDVKYILMPSIVFNDKLSCRERRIQLYKLNICARTTRDINDEDVIKEIKMTERQWGNDTFDYEYEKNLCS